MRARVTEPLNYLLWGIAILEASSCKYLGIILRNDLSWADQVKLHGEKPGRHFNLQSVILKWEQ
jgi:hypothetical protein